MEERWGSRERIWVHCAGAHNKSRYWYQTGASKQASKSREAPRSGWHGKLRPGRSREQKPSRSDIELQPRGQPPPSSRDGLAITIARHRLSVEQDN